MSKESFDRLLKSGIVVLDGATGTELAKEGMPGGVCPEAWVLEHPDAINRLHARYEAAGSQIVYAPTFGGNPFKLAEFGLREKVHDVNERLAAISKRGVKKALVFGDVAPTGKFVEPFGELPFEDAVSAYKLQVEGLLAGGVDGFAVETMMDLQEARAALIAIRELDADIPVIVTMTFDESMHTLTGNTPESAVVALQALGASAVGCNCSTGPERMLETITAMMRVARVPLVAKPNAGMPKLEDGRTVFGMSAETFGELASKIAAGGASIVGGCCGTTPEHIRALADRVRDLKPNYDAGAQHPFVSSSREVLELGAGCPFCVIGERLNPTGKKALQAELRAGKFDLVRKFAKEQAEAGAGMLDVNCGLPGVDEAATLRQIVSILSVESRLPLCIDTTNPEAAESALRLYPGRALFNSISAEKNRLEKVLPIAAKYGAQIIALPLDDAGIPQTATERAERVLRIEKEAAKYGIRHDGIVVDALVMTVSVNQECAQTSLDTIEWVAREWKGGTVCGLSNISFGLPRREIVNLAFLGCAIGRGLTMAIANPMNASIMEMAHGTDVLFSRDEHSAAFIAKYSTTVAAPAAKTETAQISPEQRAMNALIDGDRSTLDAAIDELLAAGMPAGKIVDEILVPGITQVGEKYEKQEFFLPQLMGGARAMEHAVAKLEPLLNSGKSGESNGKIILATVKGDIHDIGKNIVAMMLKNYGFEVIDLGKDVPAEVIVGRAEKEGVSIIGLSALMTTTMGEMRNVIELARKRGLDNVAFIVGGAVVDEEFAKSIGAEYSADAMETVRLAQRIMGRSTAN
ncbi:MAG: homocysteine S-methyltransferase family protein [Victivallales bacterium]|nr:homocysteine S-methyltransferase family protein [Victivallales bacterium]